MRTPLPLTLLATLALAIIQPVAAQSPGVGTVVVRGLVGRTGRVIADTMGTPYELPVPAGRAFAALAAVYADLKIDAEIRDSVRLEIGNGAFFRRGDVGGRRISAYLDCGDSFTGPRADAYRIDMSLVSFLTAIGPDQVTVRSAFLGVAVNVGEGGRPTVPCFSNGELEKRIYDMMQKKLR